MLISFDPARDTPEALRAYGEKMGLGNHGWRMIAGPDEAVAPVADLVGFRYERSDHHFTHNAVIAVADAEGVIRGRFAPAGLPPAVLGRKLTLALTSAGATAVAGNAISAEGKEAAHDPAPTVD